MDELVQEHLEPVSVVAEHRRRGPQPRDVPVMIGAEHVDRTVEPFELATDVRGVGGEVEVAAV